MESVESTISYDEFVTRIAMAMERGHAKSGRLLTREQAFARAKRVADRLMPLFTEEGD